MFFVLEIKTKKQKKTLSYKALFRFQLGLNKGSKKKIAKPRSGK